MRLSKPVIQRYLELGDIVIEPFDPRNLKSAQYDVSLGEYCYRETMNGKTAVYNPYDREHVEGKWRLDRAVRHDELFGVRGLPKLVNVAPDELIITIAPGEMILAHTAEFIGGRSDRITTTIHARSSVGRNFLEIARCAGVGDVGYFTRWTLEIVNTSRYQFIPLVVGRRIGQVMFHEIEPVSNEDMYSHDGKYQTASDLDRIKASWRPEMMLPRMYLDRECVEKGGKR